MKCFRGFLLEKDKETRKEAPFFLKVRNEDIVISQKMDINKILAKCSNTWELISANSYYDRSIYMFHLSKKGIEDDPYWTVPVSDLTSDEHFPTVTYTIYHIDGEPSMIDVDFNWFRKFSDAHAVKNTSSAVQYPTTVIRLPYALPSTHPNRAGDRITWNEQCGLTPYTIMTSQGLGDELVPIYSIYLGYVDSDSNVEDPSIKENFNKKTGITLYPGKAYPAIDLKLSTNFKKMSNVYSSFSSSYLPYQEISANMRFFLRDNNPYPIMK